MKIILNEEPKLNKSEITTKKSSIGDFRFDGPTSSYQHLKDRIEEELDSETIDLSIFQRLCLNFYPLPSELRYKIYSYFLLQDHDSVEVKNKKTLTTNDVNEIKDYFKFKSKDYSGVIIEFLNFYGFQYHPHLLVRIQLLFSLNVSNEQLYSLLQSICCNNPPYINLIMNESLMLPHHMLRLLFSCISFL